MAIADPLTPEVAAAEIKALAADARRDLKAAKRGPARISATWAGIAAHRGGLDETANPFLRGEENELFAAFAHGLRLGIDVPLPRADVHHPFARRAAPLTHAAATHAVLSQPAER